MGNMMRAICCKGKGFVMKKRVICMVLLMVAALFGNGCSASNFFDISGYTYDKADKYTMGNAELAADGMKALDIRWVSGEVKVGYHSENTVVISETANKPLDENTTMYYLVDGDTLRVQFGKSGKYSFSNLNKELTVWLPQGMELAGLEIDSVSADVSVAGLVAQRAEIDTTSGDIALDDVTVLKRAELDTTSGEIQGEFSGSLAEFSADTVSGDIKLTLEGAEKISLDSTSGGIRLTARTAPDALSIDTVSGDVVLCLPEDADFTIRLDTVSGRMDSGRAMKKDGDDYIFGAGTKKYDVDTTSGDLQVECEEAGMSGSSNNGQKGEAAMVANYADYAVVQAQYPETVAYPDESDKADFADLQSAYDAQRSERRKQSEGYRDGLYPFYGKTMQEFLVCEGNENRVYSPLNLYMALSMLAEVTDGNSRAQILELLSMEDMDAVRASALGLWNANYADDGIVTSKLANSLWLKEDVDFVPETMKRLAEAYHASSFQGDMGAPEFTKALQQWLNEQTGGLLQEQAAKIGLDDETLLALASTVYFRAQWMNKFQKSATQEGIFHAAFGDIPCDFMHQKDTRSYFLGDNFSAVFCNFEMSGGMWLFLPDEGVSVNALVQDGNVLRMIKEGYDWEDRTAGVVNLAMPKFDIVSDMDLKAGLRAMGVTDVFDEEVADFSPMIAKSDVPVLLGDARHAARVMVDEEGCIAAAYTVMKAVGAGIWPEEEIDFILDRPFVFAVTGEDGSILFLGVVEQP